MKHYLSIVGLRFRWWVFRHEFSLSSNGKWPVGVWGYKWGMAFHGGHVADAHIEFVGLG